MSRSVHRGPRLIQFMFLASIAITVIMWLHIFISMDSRDDETISTQQLSYDDLDPDTSQTLPNSPESEIIGTNSSALISHQPMTPSTSNDTDTQYINLSLYSLAQQTTNTLRMHHLSLRDNSDNSDHLSSPNTMDKLQSLSHHHGRTSTNKCCADSRKAVNSPMRCVCSCSTYSWHNSK